ncbi:related to NAD-dependent deacetylase sirtuin type 4 [Melanopsichium pennsylvanicum]|uniref:Related to NAD-dependent deacetylase sirtuin type 4 n=1 Tax=Melanopsichium pennsylvanicum TaxID=63383 RepID=A0AAJ4XMS6_9BASI|nr:related to NAD-dependent deacetylase sirtuin type 4 [Melanopsichium pennsylvanicum]
MTAPATASFRTMRISIPSIPEQAKRATIEYSLENASKMVAEFLTAAKGKALIMTGAGVSVDSGIAPYRGENGHYTVHKTYRPIFFHEFIDPSEKGHLARQRYFSRSYLGFPPVRVAKPNRTHYSIAAIQRLGYVPEFITQNVDNLHHAATPSASLAASTILELHGTLKHVVCVSSPEGYKSNSSSISSSHHHHHHHHHKAPMNPEFYDAMTATTYLAGPRAVTLRPENTPTGENYPKGCGFRGSRAVFQDELTRLNPAWAQLQREMTETGKSPKTNPDGDVELHNVDYTTFNYPACPNCGGVLKPAVIFFGESVPDKLRDHSYQMVDNANAMLLVGTSLATYSAYRLVKQAVEQNKPILILNRGPTRADPLVQNKIELGSSQVLSLVANLLSNGRERNDKVLQSLLTSGVTIQPNQASGVISS